MGAVFTTRNNYYQFFYIATRIYKFGEASDLKKWEEARLHCEEWGGHLVTITSQAHNDYLRKEMISRSGFTNFEKVNPPQQGVFYEGFKKVKQK